MSAVHRFLLIAFILSLFLSFDIQIVNSQAYKLFINEFMASNNQTITDNYGEYDDWIEIYNGENFDINLNGYYLTDELDAPMQWAFPDVIIPKKGYILIWADDDLEQSGLHANCKLSKDGEQIGLYNGVSYVDSIMYGPQHTDISYGRRSDGENNWVFFESPNNPPTPGDTNIYIYVETLDPPSFSPDEGFYTGSLSVELSTNEPEAVIYYTLDGSIPTASSVQYASPINITAPTTIRAISYKEKIGSDDLISDVATKCYILNIQHTIPLINVACDPVEFDEIYNPTFYRPGKPHPSISAHFKYFDSNNILQGDLPVSFSLHGGYSVTSPKKSHKIVFTDQNFQYDLFDQKYLYPRPSNLPSSFKSFNLIGMAADYSLIRNYLSMQLLRNAGLNSPQVAFIRLLINGNDRGIYVPIERIDEKYVKDHGFEPGNYDIIKTGCEHECDLTLKNLNGQYFEIKAGDFVAFDEFLQWLYRYGHSYDELINRIDLSSFLYYDMMCRFSNNRDSYDINYYLIRNRDVPNSKWIIFLWDTDESFGWDRNFNGRWFRHNFLFDQLWQNERYVHLIYNTLADLLNTTWSYQEIDKLIQKMENLFQTDNPADETIWNSAWYDYGAVTIPDFREDPQYNPLSRYRHLNFLREWVKNRIDFVFERFRWTGGKAQLTIETPTGGKGSIQLNSLHLTNFPWTGTYFREIQIPLTAIPDIGYRFVGWSDSSLPQTEEISITLFNEYSIHAIFEPDTLIELLVINEINYNSADNFDPEDWIELYNPSDKTIDLSNWHLKDDDDSHDFTFPNGTTITPYGYLILCHDQSAFQSLFLEVTNSIGDFDFGLSGQGDDVKIYNDVYTLVDSVSYDDVSPWPIEADGIGSTLELLDPALDNTLPQNWQASAGHGSPGQLTLALPVVNSFVIKDSSGSTKITDSRDVLIEMTETDFDGQVVKWHINENGTPPAPAEFILEIRPICYHIKSDQGDITIFGWVLDNDNQVSRLTDTSLGTIRLELDEYLFNISGTVKYNSKEQPVPDVIMTLTYTQESNSEPTDVNGNYVFSNINSGDITLEPSKEADLWDAIMGSDVLLVLQYLAYLVDITDDEKFAADVTEDDSVTGFDAQAILRYLVYYTDNIGSTGQWRFVPDGSSFTLNSDTTINFKAYLLGDANLDWSPGFERDTVGVPLLSDISLKIDQISIYEKENIEIPILIDAHNETVNTLLFSLKFDPNYLIYQSINKTRISKEFILEANGTESGKVHVAMAGIRGIQSRDEILRFIFKVVDPSLKNQSTNLTLTRVLANDRKVKAISDGVVIFTGSEQETVPDDFALFQNYPNPFNSETQIRYQLPEPSQVRITIYNLIGTEIQTIVNQDKTAGRHSVTWDGKNNHGTTMPSGIYVFELKANGFVQSNKMIMMK